MMETVTFLSPSLIKKHWSKFEEHISITLKMVTAKMFTTFHYFKISQTDLSSDSKLFRILWTI